MITSAYKGLCETDQKEVYIPGFTSEIMENIIEYAYTREPRVTPVNVERLLPAADFFHIMGLLKVRCSLYIVSLIGLNLKMNVYLRKYFQWLAPNLQHACPFIFFFFFFLTINPFKMKLDLEGLAESNTSLSILCAFTFSSLCNCAMV